MTQNLWVTSIQIFDCAEIKCIRAIYCEVFWNEIGVSYLTQLVSERKYLLDFVSVSFYNKNDNQKQSWARAKKYWLGWWSSNSENPRLPRTIITAIYAMYIVPIQLDQRRFTRRLVRINFWWSRISVKDRSQIGSTSYVAEVGHFRVSENSPNSNFGGSPIFDIEPWPKWKKIKSRK